MVIFDDDAKTVTLSVRDLLTPTGSMDMEDNLIGVQRAVLGTEAHSRYLDAQVTRGGYRKEVTVDWTGLRRGYRIHIRGRVDGLRTTRDITIVEEVKSTLMPGPLMREIEPELGHTEQCATYAYLLREAGQAIDGAQLVYVSIADDAVHELEVDVPQEACRRLVEHRLERLLDEHLESLRLAAGRRRLAAALRFPHERIREGQGVMIDDVQGAAEQGHVLLVAAPTGIGKTAAAIFPMLRAALAQNRQLYVVTAKNSQQQLALETLRQLLPGDGPACAMQIGVRDRVCMNDDPQCTSGKCPLLKDFARRLRESDLLPRLRAMGVVDADTMTLQARAEGLCPHQVSLTLMKYATVIVGDFNHVFHPDLTIGENAEGQRPLLIVDEAHNLPDRVAEHWSPELHMKEAESLAASARTTGLPIYRDAAQLLDALVTEHRGAFQNLASEYSMPPPYTGEPNRQFFDEMYGRAEVMIYRYALHIAKGGERPAAFRPRPWRGRRRPIDPMLAQLLDLRHFCRCCELPADRFAGIWHDADRLQLLCLDVAPEIRARLNQVDGAVLMSATLTPFSFFRRQFGLEGTETITLDLPSPFPRENRRLLVCDTIDTTYEKRSDEAANIAALMARCMALKTGNYLAFFSSFAFRDEVMGKLPAAAATVIRQTAGMDIRPLLVALSRNKHTTILVAAVMGGVMAEGVDFAEDLAIGAFVVGPGLPPLEPGRELVRGYFDAHHLDGFEQAYICPGLNKVVQAGGRVIRTETDRGFIVLVGRRFLDPRYHDRLPEWWRAELIAAPDPATELATFWG